MSACSVTFLACRLWHSKVDSGCSNMFQAWCWPPTMNYKAIPITGWTRDSASLRRRWLGEKSFKHRRTNTAWHCFMYSFKLGSQSLAPMLIFRQLQTPSCRFDFPCRDVNHFFELLLLHPQASATLYLCHACVMKSNLVDIVSWWYGVGMGEALASLGKLASLVET